MLATLSLTQALSLWSELERAYYNDNSYGGDTAEIYMYRLMPYSPMIATTSAGASSGTGMVAEACREAYDAANMALFELLTLFITQRPCRIIVRGRQEGLTPTESSSADNVHQHLGPWMRTARFEHRVHVQVIRP